MNVYVRISLAASICLLLLAGCSSANKPTDKNFIEALNHYYADHNECLFPGGRQFPYEVGPGPHAKTDKAQMDALTDAGMFKRLEDRSIHVSSYTLTPIGTRYAPRFCYGHRQVTSIESFTPPGPRNGFTETTVTFHYQMRDVPMWAQPAAVKKAFPELGEALGAHPTAQMTLATVGAGWHVPQ